MNRLTTDYSHVPPGSDLGRLRCAREPMGSHRGARPHLIAMAALALSIGCDVDSEPQGFDSDGTGQSDGAAQSDGAELEPRAAPRPDGPGGPDELGASGQPASASVGANPHHRVESGMCLVGDPDCVATIPMTGRSNSLFSAVDDAVRQYMKIHCTGGGTVAISRHGRRVYKRGFGRNKGIAAVFDGVCPNAQWDPTAQAVLPDTPMPIASVSKFVTAAMVRGLIEDRNSVNGCGFADVTAAPLTDSCLQLLPDHLLERMDPSLGGLTPPVTSDDDDEIRCPARTVCDGAVCPDQGWTGVTVGDLIGHTSGIVRDADSRSFLAANIAAIRGYEGADWQAAHDALAADTKYPLQLGAARNDIATELGVPDSDIIFFDYYDHLNGAHPLDDQIIAATGRCFLSPPVGSRDGVKNPGGTNSSYSNLGYQVLGRVIAHLHGDQGLGLGDSSYSEPIGFPELHGQSALGTFLAEEGIEEGIWADNAIARRQAGHGPGYDDRLLQGRAWSADDLTYVPDADYQGRPFCQLTGIPGNECDASPWIDSVQHRATWDFRTDGLSGNPEWAPRVSAYERYRGVWDGSGSLVAEMPALLPLLDRYSVRDSSPNAHWLGREISECSAATCKRSGGKNGGLVGVVAWGYQLEGTANVGRRVPVDSGQFITEQARDLWPVMTSDDPSDVRFATAFNTSNREDYWYGPDWEGKYTLVNDWKMSSVKDLLAYSLGTPDGGVPNVDWAAVDRMIEHQSRHIVGMGIGSGVSWYFYEDDTFGAALGLPGDHVGPDVPTGGWGVEFPATRIGTDVVGVSMLGIDTYTWYDDGHYSTTAGWPTDLGSTMGSADYVLPPGQLYDDIVGIAFASTGAVYSWYRDGTRAKGTPSDLGADFVGGYSVAPGQAFDDIEAVAIDWENDNRTWTRYKDGSVSKGYTYTLDGIDYDRGEVTAMSMFADKTRLWYANGYWRLFAGTVQDNQSNPVVLEEGYWDPSDGYDFSNVVAIAEGASGDGLIYYDDDQYAEITDGVVADTVASVEFPHDYDATQLQWVAIDDEDRVWSWYSTGQHGHGTPSDLGAGGSTSAFGLPLGASMSSVAGVAYDTTGPNPDAWALFHSGAVSRGHADNLGEASWSAP